MLRGCTCITAQVMNTLLEPFGNAHMRANHNSSRFGKYIALRFDSNNEVVAANMSTYILEKARVVHQLPGVRVYLGGRLIICVLGSRDSGCAYLWYSTGADSVAVFAY